MIRPLSVWSRRLYGTLTQSHSRHNTRVPPWCGDLSVYRPMYQRNKTRTAVILRHLLAIITTILASVCSMPSHGNLHLPLSSLISYSRPSSTTPVPNLTTVITLQSPDSVYVVQTHAPCCRHDFFVHNKEKLSVANDPNFVSVWCRHTDIHKCTRSFFGIWTVL